jgi:hypothetical protein
MPENSVSTPVGPDAVEKEFAETLRQAAFIFEKEKNGRFQGSILACRAVIRFIRQRGAVLSSLDRFSKSPERLKTSREAASQGSS